MSNACMWCGTPAVRYCDAVIGIEPVNAQRGGDGSVTGLLAGLESKQWTCDAPMCDNHGRQVGWICGIEPDGIDHCPYHVSSGEEEIRHLIMFALEAEKKRRYIHAAIRRARITRAPIYLWPERVAEMAEMMGADG